MTDEEMDRRLDEQPELIDRLEAADSSALDDLLEVCTGAKISTVEVRFLKPRVRRRHEVAAATPPGSGRRRPRRGS